jgi:hypothetical protein
LQQKNAQRSGGYRCFKAPTAPSIRTLFVLTAVNLQAVAEKISSSTRREIELRRLAPARRL